MDVLIVPVLMIVIILIVIGAAFGSEYIRQKDHNKNRWR